jgi:23S rRNA (cytidine1920-2'-O)/16S rRNA (cytidine1409-2'-O)-methyltransferase
MAGTGAKARVGASAKVRLDQLLVEQGHFVSREKARAAVMAGAVEADGVRVDKPGTLVRRDARLTVAAGPGYVSRGGLKLAAALDSFGLRPEGWVVADIGASTGGFTDCWLTYGAHRVYAVDVGYGQLAERLRNDPRVTVRERVNARYLRAEDVDGTRLDGASVDVSFISPRLIWPALGPLLRSGGVVIQLVKPQFELGPKAVGKGGIVRDAAAHAQALTAAVEAMQAAGLAPQAARPSPIRGAKGNREFLLWAVKDGVPRSIDVDAVARSEAT